MLSPGGVHHDVAQAVPAVHLDQVDRADHAAGLADRARDRTEDALRVLELHADGEAVLRAWSGAHCCCSPSVVWREGMLYLFRGLSQRQLAAYYALADVLLVTPLIDGMNLVCKEYVIVQQARGGNGVLVLSEFTGAADELPQAVLCNPFDVEGLSYRIEHALQLASQPRRQALGEMAKYVRVHDVHHWVSSQLAAIEAAYATSDGR